MNSESDRPLAGVRVIDVAQMYSGPMAALLLADLGAEVIKVEPPGGEILRRAWNATGDSTRRDPPVFLALNRNKKGVVLNLRTAEGRQAFLRLVETADVIVDNFRPHVWDSLDLGYEALAKHNPGIVRGSITAFGRENVESNNRTYDLIAQARAGIWAYRKVDGMPQSASVPAADCSAPLLLVAGILSALVERARTGKGRCVETSLLAGALWMQTPRLVQLPQLQVTGTGRERAVFDALNSAYEGSDSRWFVIALVTDMEWQSLCEALHVPELSKQAEFATPALRTQNARLLSEVLTGVFSSRPSSEWILDLTAADVACGPVIEPDEIYDDPVIKAANLIVDVDHPTLGLSRSIGNFVTMAGAASNEAAPLLGEHTEYILSGLGYSAAEIAGLLEPQA